MDEEWRKWLEAHPELTEEEIEIAWKKYCLMLEIRAELFILFEGLKNTY